MATSIDSRIPDDVAPAGMTADWRAAAALRKFSRAGLLLGLLGLAAFVPVFVRLSESWRVSAGGVAHHVAIFGQVLSYPAANAGALIVLGLALLGVSVIAIALSSVGHELSTARRLARHLHQLHPVFDHGVYVIDDRRAEAFCVGLLRPQVYITSGALALLDEPGRNAVLEHERAHARRRDPLRLAAGRVLTRSLFFLPGLRELRRGQQLLTEISADDNAVAMAAGDRSALAAAMLSFSEAPGAGGIDPERVDYLVGEPPSWRFPAVLCLAAILLLVVIVTLAILLGREAAGSATLAPPFLSAQPCVVMLALIPCGLIPIAAWLALLSSRASRRA